MFTYKVTKPHNAEGECNVLGVDMGAAPVWWTQTKRDIDKLENGDTIVLKIPGGTYWAARGVVKYSGAQFYVLRILGKGTSASDREYFECESIIEIPLRKKGE
jgi:hypothetical protein